MFSCFAVVWRCSLICVIIVYALLVVDCVEVDWLRLVFCRFDWFVVAYYAGVFGGCCFALFT